jgi:hypothetical protein
MMHGASGLYGLERHGLLVVGFRATVGRLSAVPSAYLDEVCPGRESVTAASKGVRAVAALVGSKAVRPVQAGVPLGAAAVAFVD